MSDTITVLTGGQATDQPSSSTKVLGAPVGQLMEMELDTRRISDEVSKLLRCIENVEKPQNSRFEISEVQFNLGFTTKGKISILCAGGEAGVEAGIKVTIKTSS